MFEYMIEALSESNWVILSVVFIGYNFNIQIC